MDYQQTMDYIYSFIDYEAMPRPPFDAANYDLRRVFELLGRLGDPHLGPRTVHIAGTKGKGSTAAMVASVLVSAGYTTGLYTSPHLISLNERIRVNNRLITNDELVALTGRLRPDIEAVNQAATYGQLTTFEVLTVLAFAYFREQGAAWQVVEVGLGGRLDATNVVQPEVCLITAISLDHTEVLGNSLAAIATEKAGIIKPGVPVVTAPQPPEVDRVIAETCRHQQAPLIRVGQDITWQGLGHDLAGQRLTVRGRRGSYPLSIPLLGEYQMENAAAAVAALEVLAEGGLKLPEASLVRGMKEVDWPGRLQILGRHPRLVVDGAHNVDSARRLRQALEQYLDFERATLIIGFSYDKDTAGIVAVLAPFFQRVIVTRSRHPRAAATAAIATEFARHGRPAEIAESVPAALTSALARAGDRDLVCATGSLFVVAEVLEEVARQGHPPA